MSLQRQEITGQGKAGDAWARDIAAAAAVAGFDMYGDEGDGECRTWYLQRTDWRPRM